MKILVIDDKQNNLRSALQTLCEHDVTVCGRIDEAEELIRKNKWDVVLCDLFMPAGNVRGLLGPKGRKFIEEEMPLGWALVLEAAQNGAKFVALVTDKNHHDHPASAVIDGIRGLFKINKSKVMFFNYMTVEDFVMIDRKIFPTAKKGDDGKNWKNFLDRLLSS